MKTKTVFIADDNTEFETEEEVRVYEKSLSLSKDIEIYITENEIAKPTAGLLRKQLPAFLLWLQDREAASAEEAQA